MLSTIEVPLWAQILLDEPASKKKESQSEDRATRHVLVLLAHGSKDPRWREPFENIFLRSRRLSDRVKLAYMEFIGPTLFDVAEECDRLGIRNLRVLPLFMASGAHLATDVPEQVIQICAKYPALKVEVLPPVGKDARVASLLSRIVQEQLDRI